MIGPSRAEDDPVRLGLYPVPPDNRIWSELPGADFDSPLKTAITTNVAEFLTTPNVRSSIVSPTLCWTAVPRNLSEANSANSQNTATVQEVVNTKRYCTQLGTMPKSEGSDARRPNRGTRSRRHPKMEKMIEPVSQAVVGQGQVHDHDAERRPTGFTSRRKSHRTVGRSFMPNYPDCNAGRFHDIGCSAQRPPPDTGCRCMM